MVIYDTSVLLTEWINLHIRISDSCPDRVPSVSRQYTTRFLQSIWMFRVKMESGGGASSMYSKRWAKVRYGGGGIM